MHWLPNLNNACVKLHLEILLFNSFPNDKILDCPKLKAFADNKSNVAKKQKFLFDSAENIIGKGENAGY